MTTPREDLAARFRNDLKLHPPKSPEVGDALDHVRSIFSELGVSIIEQVPMGRDLSLALTDLESACRNTIAAIVKNQDQFILDLETDT